MLRTGDILSNKYEILKLIGRGGMSKVWLASDIHLNKQWAIKEIDKNNVAFRSSVDERKTLREIEIMKTLDHPALPRIVDVVDEEEVLLVIMDYIQGETLQGVLNMYGPQKQEAVVTWMLEVCDILAYLHGRTPPIVYRDLKPSNLMLNSDGHIKIIDFGIAREYKGGGDTMPLGSEGFASPEHFTKNTDIRSDVYTVGSTMYTLLTGKDQTMPPYHLQLLREVNPSLSQGLEKIIAKATDKDPDRRYQTVTDLANALESYQKLDDDYISSLRAKVTRYKRMIAASVLVLLAGIILTGSGLLMERNSYNHIVESPGGSLDAKEDNLQRAISIRPKEPDAYIALIKAYAEDGRFTEDESTKFFNIYSEHKGSIPADVSYEIGEAYLSYYTGETDSSARAKLLTAEPFFSAALQGKNSSKAESYVFLAESYRTYIMSDDSLLAKEATKEDYEDLLEKSKKAIENAKNEKLRKIVSEAVLNLLEGQKIEMREAGISQYEILKVITIVSQGSDPEISQLATDTKSSIEASYTNSEKKKGSNELVYKDPVEEDEDDAN